jgi:hypothetical protein
VRLTIRKALRRAVLTRLLQLNHERYEEEVRQGLHERKGKQGEVQVGHGAEGEQEKDRWSADVAILKRKEG